VVYANEKGTEMTYELLTKGTPFDVEALVHYHVQGLTEHIIGKTRTRAIAVYVNTLDKQDTCCHVALRRDFNPHNTTEVMDLLIVVFPQTTLELGYLYQINQVYVGWDATAPVVSCQEIRSVFDPYPFFDIRVDIATWQLLCNHLSTWQVDITEAWTFSLKDIGKEL
jgi:hypothetical protein